MKEEILKTINRRIEIYQERYDKQVEKEIMYPDSLPVFKEKAQLRGQLLASNSIKTDIINLINEKGCQAIKEEVIK